MLILKLAIRTILRRKRRMFSIGILVFVGTLFLVFGDSFARSVQYYSRQSVINHFTGDFVIYAADSKTAPSPFAFTTPLPVIQNITRVTDWLMNEATVADWVPIAQNYSLITVEREENRIDVPLIYYAIDPARYQAAFDNLTVISGTFFGVDQPVPNPAPGILISRAQNERYRQNYHVELAAGETVTFQGVTPGGSVNAVGARIVGLFEPTRFQSVFDYINFVDIDTYSQLYNFTGVKTGSLPEAYANVLDAESEDDIFAAAADADFAPLAVENLEAEPLSGYTMISVVLKNHEQIDRVRRKIEAADLNILTEPWDEASGFYAPIARSLSVVVYAVVGVIFLIVAFVFMNTLIINIIERTNEIGTMRALGGEKRFIRALFLTETVLLNTAFALLGIIVSLILLVVFGETGVPLPGIVSQFLIGGGNLPLLLIPAPFLEALAVVMAVSVLATVYPIRVATTISPLAAMSRK
ncbi:MAG TPA: FtsX-like permease family protein [Spirochaetia bacterium]|nr:FtsX-like permease family protein [Spirochaetia bacterium]